MRKLVFSALALTCVGAVSTAVQADSLTLSYQGTGSGQSGLGVSYTGNNTHTGAPANFNHNGFVGRLNFEVTGTSGIGSDHFSVGQQLSVFCTDIYQSAGNGTFSLTDLSDAPQPGSYQMGADRAALISALYSVRHDSLSGGAENAAFQLAIWEIAFEDSLDTGAASFATAGLNMTSGFFQSTGGTALANTMLAEAWAAWQNGEGFHLLAGTTDGQQDLIVIIPLPAPVWMGLAGLAGIAVLRRRKMV